MNDKIFRLNDEASIMTVFVNDSGKIAMVTNPDDFDFSVITIDRDDANQLIKELKRLLKEIE